MCNSCGRPLIMVVRCNPIEITFNAKIQRGKSAISRVTDLTADIKIPLDQITKENFPKYKITCRDCDKLLSEEDVFNTANSCIFCGGISGIEECQYNKYSVCPSCAEIYLNYCRACPFKSECRIYKSR